MFLIAGVVASLLTFFDMDRTFYIPKNTNSKWRLYFLFLLFVLGNGVLASLLYIGLQGEIIPSVSSSPKWVNSLLVGVGYLTIIRAKFATLYFNEQEIPLGLELLYNSAKYAINKRINEILKEARIKEIEELTQEYNLNELKRKAIISIKVDSLLSENEKEEYKKWVHETVEDATKDEGDESEYLASYFLADFILSGSKPNNKKN